MNLSRLLVFLQFFSLTLLFFPFQASTDRFEIAIVFLIVAVILLIWTALHNKLGNFNIVPEIKDGCCLIKTGPYKYVRHPMYTSVLFIALFALGYLFILWKVAIFALLIIVLYFKAKREENLWCLKTDEYKEYKQVTKMFIPFVV